MGFASGEHAVLRLRVSCEVLDQRREIARRGVTEGRWSATTGETGEALAPVVAIDGDDLVTWGRYLDGIESGSPRILQWVESAAGARGPPS